MRLLTCTGLLCFALLPLPISARQRQPEPLPPWLLEARTVAVIIDPQAGIDPEDPNANQVAQRDVEAALAQWGRFRPVLGTADADLLIVIRRGHAHLAEPTVADPRQNRRPGSITPTDSGIDVGLQHGTPPSDSAGGGEVTPRRSSPGMQTEIGGADDLFAVYRGNASGDNQRPLDAAPAWQLQKKDVLKAHAVPAVEQFRNRSAEAEKAAAAAQRKP